tara:strand:- start:324 stop:1004 length:681 start_codon:yes stop_codon:yes gene_type:complete
MAQHEGFYYIIPATLAEEGNLTKAILYGVITSLVNKTGYCYASNLFLAQKMGRKNVGIISANLTELVEDKWIKITGREVGKRRITLWKKPSPLKKQSTPPKIQSVPSENPKGKPSENSEHSNISNSTISKVLQADACEHQNIVKVFNTFKQINPTINYGHRTNRKACLDLIKKYGLEKTIATCEYAMSIQGERYAPLITTPYQLISKLGELMIYYKKSNSTKTIII